MTDRRDETGRFEVREIRRAILRHRLKEVGAVLLSLTVIAFVLWLLVRRGGP